jgi:hypothetical protein
MAAVHDSKAVRPDKNPAGYPPRAICLQTVINLAFAQIGHVSSMYSSMLLTWSTRLPDVEALA